jgi:6-phospho-beta-glucosidase
MQFLSRSRNLRLAVLGGGGSGSPALIAALEESRRSGRLGSVEVRLYGRNGPRLDRIRRYAEAKLRSSFRIETYTQLDDALEGATHVLCMLRPGGMEGRAHDEALALRAGTPADEGIGAGGLACFLRGRALMKALAARCREKAPNALFLQMTSPLGLNVATCRAIFGRHVYGVCELPIVTAAAVSRALAKRGFNGDIRGRCFGLNHQSWLYSFRNQGGEDVTESVLRAIDVGGLLHIDSEIVWRHGALPMNYMRMYFHADRILRSQLEQGLSRGQELLIWSRRLDEAYCGGDQPDAETISKLLQARRMDWFTHAVVPFIEATVSDKLFVMPLNVAAAAVMPGISAETIVEVDCEISSRGIDPLPAPPLPPLPRKLTEHLLHFERAVLTLGAQPGSTDLADILALHPLTAAANITQLSCELAALQPEPPVLN